MDGALVDYARAHSWFPFPHISPNTRDFWLLSTSKFSADRGLHPTVVANQTSPSPISRVRSRVVRVVDES